MMREKRENFFSREKKFSLSPRAPLTLSRKAKKLFYLLLPAFVGNSAFIFILRVFFRYREKVVFFPQDICKKRLLYIYY